MNFDKNIIIQRIDELIKKHNNSDNMENTEELFFGTVTIIELLYGKNSSQIKTLMAVRKPVIDNSVILTSKSTLIKDSILGILRSIKSDIDFGLFKTIETKVSGELYGDFIALSKKALDDGQKDVAAVLASAAIEDALKKLASINGINVENKKMPSVINALKSKSLIQGAQSSIISSYVTLRNKAFHAEWDKIDIPDVNSLIAFTEGFLIKHFN